MIKTIYMTRFNQNTGNPACWHSFRSGGFEYAEFIDVGDDSITVRVRMKNDVVLVRVTNNEDWPEGRTFTLSPKPNFADVLKEVELELPKYGFNLNWRSPQPLEFD